MKKILVLLAMLPMMCYGQDNFEVKDIMTNGDRTIRISPSEVINYRLFTFRSLTEDGFNVSIYPIICKNIINYGKSNQRANYQLQIQTLSPRMIFIEKGARMLLKKYDGTNITLKTVSSDNDRIPVEFIYGDTYDILAIFQLSLAQLKDIADGDITKLRIEYTGAIKNFELDSNNFSAFAREAIKKIEEKEKIKDSFLEDF